MRVLVTGGSGFIGTNLIEYFSGRGDEVTNFDIVAPRNKAQGRYWRKVDLLDAQSLLEAMHLVKPEVVFHMGARTDLDGTSLSDYRANTDGVENLIVAMQGVKTIRRVVFASSRLVCQIGYQPKSELDYCPSTPYGASKVLGEQIVRSATDRINCPWVIVRPTSIWGPWFDVPYKTFFLSIAKERYVHPGNSQILKSFGFVGNVVYELQALVTADGEKVHGKTLYLSDYRPIDVAQMANSIQRELGVRKISSVNVRLLRVVAWVGDCLKLLGWRAPPLTTFRLNNLLTPMVHDLRPLEEIVGELPYSMDEGIKITADWMREHQEI